MILPVFTKGWYADTLKFATVALEKNQVLFTKDAEGSFQKLNSLEGVQRDTPLFIDLDMFFDLYLLAESFDIMVKSGQEGVYLAIDSKGGGFKQR